MSVYIFLYVLIISFSIYIGIIFYKNYKNLKGLSFLLFVILSSIWFILYFFTYSINNTEVLLIISRLTYGVSFLGIYVLGIFLLSFDKNIKSITNLNYGKINIKYLSILVFLFTIFISFTPYVIEGVYFNFKKGNYYELFGPLYSLYLVLELLMIIIFGKVVYDKYKNLQNINKIRYKYILAGLFIFILLGIFFQGILPIFGIYLFEKEVPLYIIPFLLAIWYSIGRYNFIDLSFSYKKIFAFLISIILVLFLFYFKQKVFFYISLGFIDYWGVSYNLTVFDIFFGIILYLLLYRLFLKILPGNEEYINLINYLNNLRERIPFIMDLDFLNIFIKNSINKNFGINYFNIRLAKDISKNTEIYKFFLKDNSVFINDIVFLEENKYKFNIKKLKKELSDDIAIIFPMKDNLNELIGFLELGFKPFNEQYYFEEIEIIKKFVKFLVGHLKYIEIYNEINILNINLDKKIDEKTIEYNNLINKQKEFISMISHEIKTPIMISSLQIENILDELNDKEIDKNNIIKEVILLKEQINKVVKLTKTIFSIEQYDLKKIKLYLEKINIVDLLKNEILSIKKVHSNIDISLVTFDDSIFIEIDKVQFTQVISNLLNNSIKFIENKNIKILITLKDKNKFLELIIEDNGVGFKNGEEKVIFDKYNTGKNKSIGLGMGLYLCDKIIKLHKGKISAENSKKLGGAKFIILLPKI